MSRRRRGDVGGSADEDGHGGAGGEGFDGEGAGRKEVAGEGGLYQSLNRGLEFVGRHLPDLGLKVGPDGVELPAVQFGLEAGGVEELPFGGSIYH